MLFFRIKNIPDLILSKYQMFEHSGVDGLLIEERQFIRQLHQISTLGNLGVHFYYIYNPENFSGSRLEIYLAFSNVNNNYIDKIRKIIKASNISKYYKISECDEGILNKYDYSNMTTLYKKERILKTVLNDEENYFYIVPNWEINEKSRLYSLFKMMESFDEKCCYRIDLFTEDNLIEQIHSSFSRPLDYLRNVNNRINGLSEHSKIQNNKIDPNVNETLHQYEDWLKKVDTSEVFRVRISVLSDDKSYSEILINSSATEILKNSSYDIKSENGHFLAKHNYEVIPDNLFDDNTPNSLKKWTTTFTVDEIAGFVRLPALYDGETIEIPKETVAVRESSGIEIGKDTNNHPVIITEKALPKHMFVCGVPGSGKTNTMLNIANSLWNATTINSSEKKLNIPFLVLEPAKKEYRELALFDIPELLIFSPSANTKFPLTINPFEFPLGLTLSEHISNLCKVFEGAFPIAPPAPFILDRAIQTIYENHNWNVRDINVGEKEYPKLSELYDQFEIELQHTRYDGEIQGNIRSVLEMRIGSLLRREMGDIFNVTHSMLAPEDWIKYPIVLELEALGEGPANFLTLLLCTIIRETIKITPLIKSDIRHVIFIEEAHNLIAPETNVKDAMDSNPKIAATAFIVKMLAEVRALKEGIIIADQLPTAMAPEVIKNTNIKLVHRLTSADDRQLVGSTMSASDMQLESMATYTSGQALFSYEKLLKPFEIQVNRVEEHGVETPNDDELYSYMINKPMYKKLREKEAAYEYEKLKNKVIELNEKEILAINKLEKFNFENITQSTFENMIDTFSNTLKGINILKNRYLWECDRLSSDFLDISKQQQMREIIEDMGKRLQENLKSIIVSYSL